MKKVIAISLILLVVAGAGIKLYKNITSGDQAADENKNVQKNVPAPVFMEDSAYAHIAKQVSFGPRVPASSGHTQCGNWIENKLTSYGAKTQRQMFTGVAYDGKARASFNIIGSIHPTASTRILLAAHWDTRPIADQDTKDQTKPIDGAIDGGSGVAVLLEIARNLQQKPLPANMGIDFIFFDNEDNGEPDSFNKTDQSKIFWCLGSQYWAANKHIPNYTAYYGILVDMVGAKDTYFAKEGYSTRYAQSVTDNVWNTAASLGYSNLFRNETGGSITDDHVFVNEIGKIPMIDIISTDGQGFGKHWHTHSDNLSSVSKTHLKAVGQTILQVLYNETSSN
jgi:glutaminyl-peptide cyclotransferase